MDKISNGGYFQLVSPAMSFSNYKTFVSRLLSETTLAIGASFISRNDLSIKDAVIETKALAKGLLDILFGDMQKGIKFCFGVKKFLVIASQSASSVVLDGLEACKLLSAVTVALLNCSSLWPTFVLVHDPSWKDYIGIQNMGIVFTRRFKADRICSQIPIKLMYLEGL
ncbi:hypothetical protein VNO77_25927 [Canavalia gladiata]|uniref:Uncharacterized protein n=1 Tax=Canavalia gladiata TaxID=3824 RepID=A0AAN9KRN2_CANGL